MIGRLYINNKDAYSTWGVCLVKGSYEALLRPAPAKKYVENKSRAEDGKQVIAKNPRVDERSVQLIFLLKGNSSSDYLLKLDSFLKEIRGGFIEVKIPALKTTYKLLYEDANKYGDYGLRIGKFYVDFNEPNPTDRIKL